MEKPETTKKVKLNLTLDLRIIIGVLLLVIVGMVFAWKPWQNTIDTNARTVQVTGETTLKAEPDEYVFNPSYEFKNTDKTAASDAATQKSNDVVAGLKKLSLEDKHIKTNISSYQGRYGLDASSANEEYVYTLLVTVTLSERTKAQQIQDYLLTTNPQGIITPQASFSESKRKQLENQARDEATKDARIKAEQNAKNLGFKLGAVKTVSDGQGFSGGIMYGRGADAIALPTSETSKSSSVSIQPGQNELAYSVTVTYYVK